MHQLMRNGKNNLRGRLIEAISQQPGLDNGIYWLKITGTGGFRQGTNQPSLMDGRQRLPRSAVAISG